MGKYFFTGGQMPSHNLIYSFQRDLTVEHSWAWDGVHYQKTSEDWLKNMDANADAIREIFKKTYGTEATAWLTGGECSSCPALSSSVTKRALYHATNDRLVEYQQSMAFEAKLKSFEIPIEHHAIPWWGHATAFVFSEAAVAAGINFLEVKLK